MTASQTLVGQVAVITGGGTGLGRSTALALAKVGANVALVGRRPETLAEVAELARKEGVQAIAVPADVSQPQSIQAAIGRVSEILGGVDILVNSAGVVRPRAALEVTESEWDEVIATNLKGAFFAAQAAARVMASRGGGRIINISSQFGLVGFRERVAYCSSKGGLTQMTRALAVEWAPLGITVNGVAPTYVETDLTRSYVGQGSFREEVLSRIPVGRMAQPDEVAAAVLYLASPAAAMVTGITLPVDGGWTAQ